MSQILTITDVSKLLQMSKSTVYKYAEQSKIPCFKLGSNLRFLENEINDFIKKTIYDQRNTNNEKLWRF
jgi:excisionase family DNA binding protein